MKLFKNNIKLAIGAISFFIFLILMVIFVMIKIVLKPQKTLLYLDESPMTNKFASTFIKEVNKQNQDENNYLISPYSVEIALNMLYSGANGTTKSEIENVINPKLNITKNDKIKIANAAFIKNKYKKYIDKEFSNKLERTFNSEILYDSYEIPDKINSWINDKTDGMIPRLVEEINPEFVLGLANAIAIDATWQNQFECNNTTKEEFTLNDNTKLDAEMMHQQYTSSVKFYDKKDKGIKIPYKEGMDFIAIMPEDGINDYIKNLSSSALDDILGGFQEATEKDKVNLSIPRFKYEYDLKTFKEVLKEIGIKDVFSLEKADLTGIISRDKLNEANIENLYVYKAIHKASINFNETGTKASAATYFEISKENVMAESDKNTIHEIKFNRPFVYIIRESVSHDILFFGVVYSPNKWNGSTCTE